MKKVFSLCLALCLCLSLAACGATSKPDAVVNSFCTALKSFDEETIASCVVDGKTTLEDPYSDDSEVEQDLSSEQAIEYLKSCAEKMTFSIGTYEVADGTASVPVTFTYVDASPVVTAAIGDYLSQAFALALGGADDTALDELFGSIFMEKTKSVETGTATADVTLDCVKTDDGWKISSLSEETASAITNMLACNMVSAFEGFGGDSTDNNSEPEDTVWHDVSLGEEVELATIKICITGCEELSELTAEYYSSDVAQSGTKFVVFSADIENITKDTINFNNDLSLTDSQGRTYNPYSNALWYYDQTFSYTDLAPNIKQSGQLVYNVPADSNGYYLSVIKGDTSDGYHLYA